MKSKVCFGIRVRHVNRQNAFATADRPIDRPVSNICRDLRIKFIVSHTTHMNPFFLFRGVRQNDLRLRARRHKANEAKIVITIIILEIRNAIIAKSKSTIHRAQQAPGQQEQK